MQARRAGRGEEICECGPAWGDDSGGEGSGEVENGLTGLVASVDWIYSGLWSGGLRVFFGWPFWIMGC